MRPTLHTFLIATGALCGLATTAVAAQAPPGPDFQQTSPARHDVDRALAAAGAGADVLPVAVIPFAFDASSTSPLDRPTLRDAARWLAAHPGFRLVVESHADARGGAAYNAVLSARRALVVRDWLVELGAPPDRVIAASYGEARPVAKDPFAAANRCAVVYATRLAPAAIARSMRADGAAILQA